VSPAIILAASIFHTASMVRWVSVVVTATHLTIFNSAAQVGTSGVTQKTPTVW